MKPLRPSMRENKRYLLIRLSQARSDSSGSRTNGKNLKSNIEKAILDFIGVLGMSKTGLGWIKTDKNSAVISVNREAVNSVRASLAVWPEKMIVERISGTLKGLKKK